MAIMVKLKNADTEKQLDAEIKKVKVIRSITSIYVQRIYKLNFLFSCFDDVQSQNEGKTKIRIDTASFSISNVGLNFRLAFLNLGNFIFAFKSKKIGLYIFK